MKKFYLICLIFIMLSANAQQMVVPSSFDENKMIVKRMDENGNFVPVDENTLPEEIENKASKKHPKRLLFQKNESQKKDDIVKRSREFQIEKEELLKKDPPLTKEPPKKKFKKKEKDYSIQKSTFNNSSFDDDLPTTFTNETMDRAQDDLTKERYSFEECDSDDKDCQEYDIDSKGHMILR